jgi:hypothetical protein
LPSGPTGTFPVKVGLPGERHMPNVYSCKGSRFGSSQLSHISAPHVLSPPMLFHTLRLQNKNYSQHQIRHRVMDKIETPTRRHAIRKILYVKPILRCSAPAIVEYAFAVAPGVCDEAQVDD